MQKKENRVEMGTMNYQIKNVRIIDSTQDRVGDVFIENGKIVDSIDSDYEEIDYEVIAGLVVMELTVNHISMLAKHAPNLIEFTGAEKQYEPSLLITSVQPTSIFHKARLIGRGMVIEEINGEKVKTLDDFRKAVKKSKKTKFLTVKTDDHRFVVASVENIVKDEDRLSSMYFFNKSKLIDDIK